MPGTFIVCLPYAIHKVSPDKISASSQRKKKKSKQFSGGGELKHIKVGKIHPEGSGNIARGKIFQICCPIFILFFYDLIS